MVEKNRNLPDILDILFKDDDTIKLKITFFIDRISNQEGICRLILGRFNTGAFRLYAVWENEKIKDSNQIQGIWHDVFERENMFVDGDPLVIQLTNKEYVNRLRSGQYKNMQRRVIWSMDKLS